MVVPPSSNLSHLACGLFDTATPTPHNSLDQQSALRHLGIALASDHLNTFLFAKDIIPVNYLDHPHHHLLHSTTLARVLPSPFPTPIRGSCAIDGKILYIPIDSTHSHTHGFGILHISAVTDQAPDLPDPPTTRTFNFRFVYNIKQQILIEVFDIPLTDTLAFNYTCLRPTRHCHERYSFKAYFSRSKLMRMHQARRLRTDTLAPCLRKLTLEEQHATCVCRPTLMSPLNSVISDFAQSPPPWSPTSLACSCRATPALSPVKITPGAVDMWKNTLNHTHFFAGMGHLRGVYLSDAFCWKMSSPEAYPLRLRSRATVDLDEDLAPVRELRLWGIQDWIRNGGGDAASRMSLAVWNEPEHIVAEERERQILHELSEGHSTTDDMISMSELVSAGGRMITSRCAEWPHLDADNEVCHTQGTRAEQSPGDYMLSLSGEMHSSMVPCNGMVVVGATSEGPLLQQWFLEEREKEKKKSEREKKLEKRKEQNRAAARVSNERKRQYVLKLKEGIRSGKVKAKQLQEEDVRLRNENMRLRERLKARENVAQSSGAWECVISHGEVVKKRRGNKYRRGT